MARKKASGINKSQVIREYLAKNPDASPKQVVEALGADGIEVSEGLASNVKYTSRNKVGTARRRGRPPGRLTRTTRNGASVTAEDLLNAKKLVDNMGGIDVARRAIDTLEQLR